MGSKRLLFLVDDWPETLVFMSNALESFGFITETFDSIESVIKRLREKKPDIILVDFSMPEINGLDFLKILPSIAPDVPAILMTGIKDNLTQVIVEAIKNNAVNFIEKTESIESIIQKINLALSANEGKNISYYHSSEIKDRFGFIGASPSMQVLCKSIEEIARTNYPVLLIGETGTGKELVAKAIHLLSERRAEVFLAINCGTIVDTLAESELFGHVKGAFTGAITGKPGYFKLAEKGSLYLDEISEANPSLQVKLLRALDPGEFTPVGGVPESVKTRIIASSNRKISTKNPGNLRPDLIFRFEPGIIYIPPLRERKEDIPLLVQYFLSQEKLHLEAKKDVYFTNDALEYLAKMEWEGNVRELKNFVRKMLLFVNEDKISMKTIIDFLKMRPNIALAESKDKMVDFIIFCKDVILDIGADSFLDYFKKIMFKFFLE